MSAVVEMAVKAPRVLIVEDEVRLRELLVEVVPDMGFPATAVRSGEEAIRVLQGEAYDILILDLQLPGMGGMELFERVREEWPGVQVIVLTGFGDLPTAQRAIHLDVVDFLSKPCHLSTLEMALDRARRRTRIGGERGEEKTVEEDRGLTLAEVEHQQIMAALERSGGNKKAAAAALGISRRTLHYRLAEYRGRRD
ncbi:MAG TPA: response regulator [Tepidisphaeraceae bacterium]|jgi:DNA-binding NtrC family response regulator|nr:response regulator [Tepidisphaeraceae bacterium]